MQENTTSKFYETTPNDGEVSEEEMKLVMPDRGVSAKSKVNSAKPNQLQEVSEDE